SRRSARTSRSKGCSARSRIEFPLPAHSGRSGSGKTGMESSVRAFFDRYARFFNQSIHGDMDMDEAAALYTSEFIAASPAGVRAGKNDEQFKQFMAQGYAHYRAIGTKGMAIRNVRISP